MIDDIFLLWMNYLFVYNGKLNISKLESFPDTYMLGYSQGIIDEDILDLIFTISS